MADKETHPTIALLMGALQAYGIDTEGLTFEYEETTVGYPGGSYKARSICVSTPPFLERFDAPLTAKNPYVTANEIATRFGRKRNPVT